MIGVWKTAVAVLCACRYSQALKLNVDSDDSIRSVASTIAYEMQTYYSNNASDTPPDEVGVFPAPYYWWRAAAMWGALVDYWSYTGDSSYVNNTINAFIAQSGPDRNFMVPKYYDQTGNDDQGFWALFAMTAAEQNFPSPQASEPQYLDVAIAAFNTQVARWDTAGCNGGLRWQVFSTHPGYPYMNTISNGCFFQLAARLARYTGNSTYIEWASKTWDWVHQVGLIDGTCTAFDGTDSNKGCSDLNHDRWSYNVGVYLHGAAMLYNHTGDPKWADATNCLLDATSFFFSPAENATDIMYEPFCEPGGTCNMDAQTFKAHLSQWMAKTSVVAPWTQEKVMARLRPSALAAATSCAGRENGTSCGTRWYEEGWDGTFGFNQQLTALEVIQGLLVGKAPPPQTASGVAVAR